MHLQTWTLLMIHGALEALSSPPPPLHQTLLVHSGSNVSLSCNLSSTDHQTWFRLDSDRIQPLFTIRPGKLRGVFRQDHQTLRSLDSTGDLEGGVSLEIRSVTVDDSGVYICSSQGRGELRFNSALHLRVTEPGSSPVPGLEVPKSCWSPGLCLVPGLICALLCATVAVCHWKRQFTCGCCCVSKVSEDAPLHYSSLKHMPRPFGRANVPLAQDNVTYSTVKHLRNLQSEN